MPRSPQPLLGEDQLLALAAGGERVVARVRLAVIFCICLFPLTELLFGTAPRHDIAVAFMADGAALLLAIIYLIFASPRVYRPWISYLTSLSDVTLVSARLAAFLLSGDYVAAVYSTVTWPVYLIAIAACALRPRPGIVPLATFVAIGEYLAISFFANVHWQPGPNYIHSFYAEFNWTIVSDRVIILALMGLLAIALTRRAFRLTRFAGTDVLTGTFSRTYFKFRLDEEIQRALRHRRPLTLAMLDMDHLKQINDQHGHGAGDAALTRFTEHLKDGLRSSDNIFRYGGDEFAVLMPELKPGMAFSRLENIAELMRNDSRQGFPLTFSAGLAGAPDDASSAAALLHAADQNLYAAKRRGRNCIVADRDEPAADPV